MIAIMPKIDGISWNPPDGLTKPKSEGCGSWVAKSRKCVKSIINRKSPITLITQKQSFLGQSVAP